MVRLALIVCLAAACGGRHSVEAQPDAGAADAAVGDLAGQPLPVAGELVIVAHQDDDQLFMQPDLYETVTNRRPLTVVYVTAGDANTGVAYADSRVADATTAYGVVAGTTDWSCGWISIAGHAAQHCRLADANLSLVFLGYPDGGLTGNLPNSLLQLWQGATTGADTVADHVAHYDQGGLIATVAEIITTTEPRLVRTLDISGAHGSDHADHVIVGALTVLALASAGSDANVVSYRGYDVNSEPANVLDAVYDKTSLGMRAYEACASGCAPCGQACTTITDPRYLGFLHRRYAIGIRRPPLAGVLRHHDQCVVIDDTSLALGDCSKAAHFTFERGGAIRADKRCVRVQADRTIALGDCEADPARNFLLDDEGHLWTGVVPAPGEAAIDHHAVCVVANGPAHELGAATCGANLDWTWELVAPTIATSRATLGLTQTGRAMRLGDLTGDGKADLCSIEATGLMCAKGDGTGRFTQAVRIDAPAAPLAIEPQSLAIGDVDGDGKPDACGRSAQGLLCATAASGFVAAPWSPEFARAGGACPADRSLAIVDGSVCGTWLAAGIGCTTSTTIFSSWPATTAEVWPADLDGDDVPDWCTATVQGIACSRTSDHALLTEPLPWAYSMGGVVEGTADGSPPTTTTAALGDISGDGRADACVAVGREVLCGISQGHGFGPRTTVLELPQLSITALWLGDLDGDGKADACVDDGTSITCMPRARGDPARSRVGVGEIDTASSEPRRGRAPTGRGPLRDTC